MPTAGSSQIGPNKCGALRYISSQYNLLSSSCSRVPFTCLRSLTAISKGLFKSTCVGHHASKLFRLQRSLMVGPWKRSIYSEVFLYDLGSAGYGGDWN